MAWNLLPGRTSGHHEFLLESICPIMKSPLCWFTPRGWIALVLGIGMTAGARTLVAAPRGGEVTAGAAQILGGEGGVIVQQSTHRAILRWDDFSLSPSEFAQFVVPSADAATLNRVTGGMVSRIDGSLRSNGRLFLLNPNGILVGPGGTIDTAGFLGSTYNLADEDFLDGGNFLLSGDSTASVVNRGTIRAVDGDIFLFGHTVENHGSLEAPLGTVGLAAGKEIRVMESGQERISVSVSEHSAAESPSVTHTGTIDGAVAELKAHGNMYALAINHEGVTRATGAVQKDGRVILSAGSGTVRQSGTVRARNSDGSGGSVRVATGSGSRAEIAGTVDARGSSGRGGAVEVRGGEAIVEDSARIDVSGPAGGGSISIGKGPATEPGGEVLSRSTTVESGGILLADALVSGPGGSVEVASVGGTAMHGSVRARGAGPAGPGGDATFTGVTDLRVGSIADLRGAGQGEHGLAVFEAGDLSVGPGPGGAAGLPARFSDEFVEDQLRFANVRLAALGPLGEVDAKGILHVEPGTSLRWFGDAGLELYGRGMVHLGAETDILNIGEGALAMTGDGAGGALPTGTPGVLVENAVVRTTEGSIALSGTGSSGGAGVVLRDGTIVEATEGLRNPATGVFIEGRGGAGEAAAPGIVLEGAGSAVRSGFGGLRLSGEGSSAVQGVGAAGIIVGGMIQSLGAGPGAAELVLEGAGSAGSGGHGIVLGGAASVEAASADIILMGRTIGSGDGIVLREGAQIRSSFAGLIRLFGRSAGGGADLRWENLVITGKTGGLLELDGSAVGQSLRLGSAEGPGNGFAFRWNGGGSISGDVDFHNSQGVTLAIEEGDPLKVGGSVEVHGGPVSIRGSIEAEAGIRFDQSSVLLAGSTRLASGEGSILLGPVDGSGIALDLDAPLGEVRLDSAANVIGDLAIRGDRVWVVENDAITQSGAWTTGETLLDAQENEINLSDTGNVLGALVMKGGKVTLVENDAITQAGAWETGETSLDSQGHEIDLSEAGNVLGSLVVKGGKVTLVENDAITQSGAWMTGETSLDSQGNEIVLGDVGNVLGALVMKGGHVTLVENDAITQSGAWMTGATSLDSLGNEINLSNAGNVLGALVIKGGKLTLVENDAITQSGAWTTGETSLDSQGNEIDLSDVGNVLGALVVKGGKVTLVENDAITQTGAWMTGETWLDSQGNEIVLGDVGNVLGAVVMKSGHVTLVENDAITQSWAWMTVATSLDSQGNEIVLSDAENVLGALVVKGGKVTLVENDKITQSGAWMTGETSLDAQGNEIDLSNAGNVLGALVIKGGKVTLVENDVITQSAAWTTGETSLDSQGNEINLSDAGNVFGLLGGAGGSVRIRDSGSAELGAWTVAGDFEVHASGGIAGADPIQVGGRARFVSGLLNAGTVELWNSVATVFGASVVGGDLLLHSSGDVGQVGGLAVAGTVMIHDAPDVVLAHPDNVLPFYELPSGDVLIDRVGPVQLDAQDVAGDLIVNSKRTGRVFDGEALTESAIELLSQDNRFEGELQLTTTAAPLVQMTSAEAPGITQSGALHVAGRAFFFATLEGDIDLFEDGNVFGDLTVLGNRVRIRENGDITQFQAWTTGSAELRAGDHGILLGNPANRLGDLSLRAGDVRIVENDAITQSGPWQTGRTELDAGDHAILLTDRENQLGDLVVRAGEVRITENGAITQGGAWSTGATRLDARGHAILLSAEGNVLGDLQLEGGDSVVREDDAITQNGPWKLGDVVLDAGAHAISLGNAANELGDLTIESGDLLLREAGAITQNGPWRTGSTLLDAGNEAVLLPNADNVLGDLTVRAGTVRISENDDITAGSAWTTGDTRLDAGDHLIRLDALGSVFGDLGLRAAGALLVEDDVVTQAEAWDLEVLQVEAGGHDIFLTKGGNRFGQVALSGRNVELVEADSTVLGGGVVSGRLLLQSGGSITQSHPVSVARLEATANSGPILLQNPANRISVLGPVSAVGSSGIFGLGGLLIDSLLEIRGGSVEVGTAGGDLVLGPAGMVRLDTSGQQIVLHTDRFFLNQSDLRFPLVLGRSGRWLIYAGQREGSVLGSLVPDAVEVDINFPEPPLATGGNVFIIVSPDAVSPPDSSINDFSEGSLLFAEFAGTREKGQYEVRREGEGESEGEDGAAVDEATAGGSASGSDALSVENGDGVVGFDASGILNLPNVEAPRELFDGVSDGAVREMRGALDAEEAGR